MARMDNDERIKHVQAALMAGMPGTSAHRWPQYLEMKARKGETPITLATAAAQVRAAGKGR